MTRKVVLVLVLKKKFVLILVWIKRLDILKTLINGNTKLTVGYICNFKTLIFTFISIIYYEAIFCMQHFQFVTAFTAVQCLAFSVA